MPKTHHSSTFDNENLIDNYIIAAIEQIQNVEETA